MHYPPEPFGDMSQLYHVANLITKYSQNFGVYFPVWLIFSYIALCTCQFIYRRLKSAKVGSDKSDDKKQDHMCVAER